MRRKFEQFCSRVALDVRRNSDGFKSTLTEGAWLGWREAFAVFQSDVDSLRARVAGLEAERAELVKEAKKSVLMELKEELEGGYCPPEEKAGVAYAIDSINDSLEYLDAAREGE